MPRRYRCTSHSLSAGLLITLPRYVYGCTCPRRRERLTPLGGQLSRWSGTSGRQISSDVGPAITARAASGLLAYLTSYLAQTSPAERPRRATHPRVTTGT